MLRAGKGKVVLRKYDPEQNEPIGLYLPTSKETYYEVVDTSVQDLASGDLVIVRKENLYSVYHENKEYYIVTSDDILAKCVK